MSQTLLSPGTYPAKTNGQMVVYEPDSGSLCVAVPLCAFSPEGEQLWSGKTTICLGKADGTLMTKAIENLKRCFPQWDGLDPFGLEGIVVGVDELEIVGIHENYTPKPTDDNPDPQPITVFKVQWLNPPGGGGATMREPLDESSKKKVLTRWAGKFKAMSAPAAKSAPKAVPAAPAAPAAKSPPTPPSRGKAPSRPAASRKMTGEEVWEKLKSADTETPEDDLAAKFYAAQDEVAPGGNGNLSEEQWGQVATELGI